MCSAMSTAADRNYAVRHRILVENHSNIRNLTDLIGGDLYTLICDSKGVDTKRMVLTK